MRREVHHDKGFRLRYLPRQAGVEKEADRVHCPVHLGNVGKEGLRGRR
jgi:hypothetical protein